MESRSSFYITASPSSTHTYAGSEPSAPFNPRYMRQKRDDRKHLSHSRKPMRKHKIRPHTGTTKGKNAGHPKNHHTTPQRTTKHSSTQLVHSTTRSLVPQHTSSTNDNKGSSPTLHHHTGHSSHSHHAVLGGDVKHNQTSSTSNAGSSGIDGTTIVVSAVCTALALIILVATIFVVRRMRKKRKLQQQQQDMRKVLDNIPSYFQHGQSKGSATTKSNTDEYRDSSSTENEKQKVGKVEILKTGERAFNHPPGTMYPEGSRSKLGPIFEDMPQKDGVNKKRRPTTAAQTQLDALARQAGEEEGETKRRLAERAPFKGGHSSNRSILDEKVDEPTSASKPVEPIRSSAPTDHTNTLPDRLPPRRPSNTPPSIPSTGSENIEAWAQEVYISSQAPYSEHRPLSSFPSKSQKDDKLSPEDVHTEKGRSSFISVQDWAKNRKSLTPSESASRVGKKEAEGENVAEVAERRGEEPEAPLPLMPKRKSGYVSIYGNKNTSHGYQKPDLKHGNFSHDNGQTVPKQVQRRRVPQGKENQYGEFTNGSGRGYSVAASSFYADVEVKDEDIYLPDPRKVEGVPPIPTLPKSFEVKGTIKNVDELPPTIYPTDIFNGHNKTGLCRRERSLQRSNSNGRSRSTRSKPDRVGGRIEKRYNNSNSNDNKDKKETLIRTLSNSKDIHRISGEEALTSQFRLRGWEKVSPSSPPVDDDPIQGVEPIRNTISSNKESTISPLTRNLDLGTLGGDVLLEAKVYSKSNNVSTKDAINMPTHRPSNRNPNESTTNPISSHKSLLHSDVHTHKPKNPNPSSPPEDPEKEMEQYYEWDSLRYPQKISHQSQYGYNYKQNPKQKHKTKPTDKNRNRNSDRQSQTSELADWDDEGREDDVYEDMEKRMRYGLGGKGFGPPFL